ncbi:pyridoxamine 5'-phosphate oxidase family protein [candidate division WOR-3 bacterium]|nr:pyridoxamine 5'-phosphate oxidase family protein [candidate division WOR-3 bacterium]
MKSWHTRHPDKAITDSAEIARIVAGQKFLTLAMCAENQPYLVTLSHAHDADRNCFYFHCAPTGRKLDLIAANPQVYGQVLEDCGYVPGECEHRYRTVQFEGEAELVTDPDEKLHALRLLIERLEPAPGTVKARLLKPERLGGVAVIRVKVESWSGKQGS